MRRCLAMLAVLVAISVTSACSSGSASTPDTSEPTSTTADPAALTTGFVQRNGSKLTVDGAPWRFVGYNLPCSNPFVMQPGELEHYLDLVQTDSGANVVRLWFFQSNGGPSNWAPFDATLAALKARGMRAVVALTDEWNGACDSGAGAEKTVDWYQGGYRQPDQGHALAYRDYAVQVAAHFANDPVVAVWQLVNEAQANTKDAAGQLSCDNDAGQKALRAFSDDMTGAMKAVDPHHLVNLGTIGGSQCGVAGSAAYQFVHDGLLDVCEYHDYGMSAAALPIGQDRLTQRVHDCATLEHGAKPMFIGEAGIQGNVQADGGPDACTPWPACSPAELSPETLTRRATLFSAKIHAAMDAGVVGYIVWVKSPYYSPSSDIYAIGDGDPTEGALKAASTELKTH